MVAHTDCPYCRLLVVAFPATCFDPALDLEYQYDSANYIVMVSLLCRLYSSYNCYASPSVIDVLMLGVSMVGVSMVDVMVVDPSGSVAA